MQKTTLSLSTSSNSLLQHTSLPTPTAQLQPFGLKRAASPTFPSPNNLKLTSPLLPVSKICFCYGTSRIKQHGDYTKYSQVKRNIADDNKESLARPRTQPQKEGESVKIPPDIFDWSNIPLFKRPVYKMGHSTIDYKNISPKVAQSTECSGMTAPYPVHNAMINWIQQYFALVLPCNGLVLDGIVTLNIRSRDGVAGLLHLNLLCLEVAFSQSLPDIKRKVAKMLHRNPHLLAGVIINLVEHSYQPPSCPPKMDDEILHGSVMGGLMETSLLSPCVVFHDSMMFTGQFDVNIHVIYPRNVDLNHSTHAILIAIFSQKSKKCSWITDDAKIGMGYGKSYFFTFPTASQTPLFSGTTPGIIVRELFLIQLPEAVQTRQEGVQTRRGGAVLLLLIGAGQMMLVLKGVLGGKIWSMQEHKNLYYVHFYTPSPILEGPGCGSFTLDLTSKKPYSVSGEFCYYQLLKVVQLQTGEPGDTVHFNQQLVHRLQLHLQLNRQLPSPLREEFLKPPTDITRLLALVYTSRDEHFAEKVAAEQQYWQYMMQLQMYKADLIAAVQGCHQAEEDIQGLRQLVHLQRCATYLYMQYACNIITAQWFDSGLIVPSFYIHTNSSLRIQVDKTPS
ncbi:hypothetical protein SERLA73DRAFT_149050 [Serpula lacrymans var. lacrymans S7.3]|uniref:Uncharacterized protein n=1 Tax=Serpula lacrymans var. lacrymans (strain S7.3) TaxID=936435 RepID=F8PI32_SERL3|nr:hypothetical protein SERLA73DRAFT_149050 [Serpula lacrymans var. lacrymans S7.3]